MKLRRSSRKSSNVELPDDAISLIYKNSVSFASYAANLMTSMFDTFELTSCTSVNGMRCIKQEEGYKNTTGLDENRVEIIRQLVQDKAGPSNAIWRKCVKAMNNRILSLKKRIQKQTK